MSRLFVSGDVFYSHQYRLKKAFVTPIHRIMALQSMVQMADVHAGLYSPSPIALETSVAVETKQTDCSISRINLHYL